MADIQTQDPGRALEMAYDLVGASPAPLLSPELVGVTIIDDLAQFNAQSARFLKPYMQRRSQAAVAVQHAQMQLQNPPGSDTIVMVQSGRFSTTVAASRAQIGALAASSVGVGTQGRSRDGRINDFGAGRIMSTTLAGAGPTTLMHEFLVGLEPDVVPIPLPFVLMPGDKLDINLFAQNQVFVASLFWWERPVPKGT